MSAAYSIIIRAYTQGIYSKIVLYFTQHMTEHLDHDDSSQKRSTLLHIHCTCLNK